MRKKLVVCSTLLFIGVVASWLVHIGWSAVAGIVVSSFFIGACFGAYAKTSG